MVMYCYNYASLILDEIIKMSVNSGHYNQSNIALTLHDVDHEWVYIQQSLHRVKDDINCKIARHLVLNSYFGLYIFYSNIFALK